MVGVNGAGKTTTIGKLARRLQGEGRRVMLAAVLAILGGFCQLYVTIIGGQAYPQVLFPGKQVSSAFQDGEIASYAPSMPEWLLGIGGIALAVLLVLLITRVLPFLPDHRRSRTAA